MRNVRVRVLYCTTPVRNGLYAAGRYSRAWYTDAWRTDCTLLATRRSVLVSAIDVWHACLLLWSGLTALPRVNLGHLRRNDQDISYSDNVNRDAAVLNRLVAYRCGFFAFSLLAGLPLFLESHGFLKNISRS